MLFFSFSETFFFYKTKRWMEIKMNKTKTRLIQFISTINFFVCFCFGVIDSIFENIYFYKENCCWGTTIVFMVHLFLQLWMSIEVAADFECYGKCYKAIYALFRFTIRYFVYFFSFRFSVRKQWCVCVVTHQYKFENRRMNSWYVTVKYAVFTDSTTDCCGCVPYLELFFCIIHWCRVTHADWFIFDRPPSPLVREFKLHENKFDYFSFSGSMWQ